MGAYHIWKMQVIIIPSIGWYIWLETKLINGILLWSETRLPEQTWAKKMAFTAIRRQNSWTCDLNWVEKMQEYTKHIAQWILGTFKGVSASVYILKPCQEIGQSFEERLRGKHVENLEIFWMKNKTILLLHLGWTSSSICIILHILLSLIQ